MSIIFGFRMSNNVRKCKFYLWTSDHTKSPLLPQFGGCKVPMGLLLSCQVFCYCLVSEERWEELRWGIRRIIFLPISATMRTFQMGYHLLAWVTMRPFQHHSNEIKWKQDSVPIWQDTSLCSFPFLYEKHLIKLLVFFFFCRWLHPLDAMSNLSTAFPLR